MHAGMTTIVRPAKKALHDSGLRTNLLQWCQGKVASYDVTIESLKIHTGDRQASPLFLPNLNIVV